MQALIECVRPGLADRLNPRFQRSYPGVAFQLSFFYGRSMNPRACVTPRGGLSGGICPTAPPEDVPSPIASRPRRWQRPLNSHAGRCSSTDLRFCQLDGNACRLQSFPRGGSWQSAGPVRGTRHPSCRQKRLVRLCLLSLGCRTKWNIRYTFSLPTTIYAPNLISPNAPSSKHLEVDCDAANQYCSSASPCLRTSTESLITGRVW